MHAGYMREVSAHCPNAANVSDLSHVVAKYGKRSSTGCGSIRPTSCVPTARAGA